MHIKLVAPSPAEAYGLSEQFTWSKQVVCNAVVCNTVVVQFTWAFLNPPLDEDTSSLLRYASWTQIARTSEKMITNPLHSPGRKGSSKACPGRAPWHSPCPGSLCWSCTVGASAARSCPAGPGALPPCRPLRFAQRAN